jgi:hypothetical protein
MAEQGNQEALRLPGLFHCGNVPGDQSHVFLPYIRVTWKHVRDSQLITGAFYCSHLIIQL